MKISARGNNTDIGFSTLIPFTNDLDLLELHTSWFRQIDRQFKALLDSKFCESPESIEMQSRGQLLSTFENPGAIIETGYADFVSHAASDWLLRLDSDEIASRNLFDFLDNNLAGIKSDWVVGIPRFQVVMMNGNFFSLMSEDFIPERHVQFRFVNKYSRKFGMETPHNPGFLFDERKKIIAPISCAIYHLDFLVRSQTFRASKSAIYDSLGQAPHMKNIQTGSQKNPKFATIVDTEVLNFLIKNKEKFFEWEY
jgi:hypothetical protein